MDKVAAVNTRSAPPRGASGLQHEAKMISHLSRIGFLALACLACAPNAATARTPYDGSWSVLIVTQRGTCDRAYRYGVQIVNGRVIYNGGAVNMSGHVTPRGAVSVSVSSGSAYANGSGRLSRSSGRGQWRGRSGSSACSGYWEAERRG
jgi:hypothetical protein